MAANVDRDNSILNIGKQCSYRTCSLVDFLPYKCQHCGVSYCGDHFLPQTHQCEKYDESKHNRVAPPCPFCKVPIAIPLGEDPNIRMERHFDTDCSVLTGKAAKSSTPRCSRPACRKVLFSAIRCDKCKMQFCPQHRFPDDHKCSGASTLVSKVSTPSSGAFTPSTRSNTTSAVAMAAIKRAVNTTTSAASAASQKMAQPTPSKFAAARPGNVAASVSATSTASSSSGRSNNIFSATDRRAKAERESRLKAMQARANKGLLSEEEKVLLAAAEADKASDKDCIIA